jgi:hypothetical protein
LEKYNFKKQEHIDSNSSNMFVTFKLSTTWWLTKIKVAMPLHDNELLINSDASYK